MSDGINNDALEIAAESEDGGEGGSPTRDVKKFFTASPEKLLSLLTIVIAVISNAIALFIKFYSFREITDKSPDTIFDFLKYLNEFIQILVLVLIYFYLSMVRFPHEVNTERIQKYIQRLFRGPVKLYGNPKEPTKENLEYLGRLNLRVFNNNWRWAWASMIMLYMLLLFTDTPVVITKELPDYARMWIEIALHALSVLINALGGLFLLTCYFIMLSPIRKITRPEVDAWARGLRRKTILFLLLIFIGTGVYIVAQWWCLNDMQVRISRTNAYAEFMERDTLTNRKLTESRLNQLRDSLSKLPGFAYTIKNIVVLPLAENIDTIRLDNLKKSLTEKKLQVDAKTTRMIDSDIVLLDSVKAGIAERNRLNPVFEMLDSDNLANMEADAPLMLDVFLRKHDSVLPPQKSVLTDPYLPTRKLSEESIRYFCQANYYFAKKKNDMWSDLLSGIFNCMAIALFVSRIDSKLVHINSWLIAILYAYAAIQPLFAYFPDGSPFIVNFVLYAALALKVQFFIIVAQAVSDHRLTDLFLFTPYVKKMRSAIWLEQAKTDEHVSKVRGWLYKKYVTLLDMLYALLDKIYRTLTLRFMYDENETINGMLNTMTGHIKAEQDKTVKPATTTDKPKDKPYMAFNLSLMYDDDKTVKDTSPVANWHIKVERAEKDTKPKKDTPPDNDEELLSDYIF